MLKLLFAHSTAIHEITGYTPFHVNFGLSPTLVVDIMMGIPVRQKELTVSDFVHHLNSSLINVYSQVNENIKVAQCQSKQDMTSTSPKYVCILTSPLC